MINLMNYGNHGILLATALQWGRTIFWPIKEILLREGSLGKTFLFHNERSTAFSSLPACTMTSEDVMSGAIAAP